MTLRKLLILRKPRSGCLEGRTALIQAIDNSFTSSQAEVLTRVSSTKRSVAASMARPLRPRGACMYNEPCRRVPSACGNGIS